MAQLKDIKSRLQSVKSTQKITTAMMMVASARLRQSQNILENLFPYKEKLTALLKQLLSEEKSIDSPYTEKREVERVAIVAFSSNTGLAGRFNINVSNELKRVLKSYEALGKENIPIYTLGSRVTKEVRKMGLEPEKDYSEISGKTNYNNAQKIAGELMELFLDKKVDRVELIYHHFISKGSQEVVNEQFLPFTVNTDNVLKDEDNIADNEFGIEYIVEPNRATIMEQLVPKVLKVNFFTAHIDSVTSEHAARMVAMQIANDNADELIDELTLDYNKLRQESITNELLDIMSGAYS